MKGARERRLLLLGAIAALIVICLVTVMVSGVPEKYDVIYTLKGNDPFLRIVMPDTVRKGTLDTSDYVLQEDKSLYHLSDAGDVTVLLLEVYEKKGEDLSGFEAPDTAEDLKLPVILREGTGNGDVKWEGFGYSAAAPNATVEIKGTPKENRKYHNFKIRLKESAGRYEGQTILNLKKGYGKPCKVEEKFAFDLFAALPDMLSLRTKFVHVYVKNAASPSPSYESYGLYTMVEQPDENYFLNRSLDDSALLYQAEDFDFRLKDALRDVEDKEYSKKEFQKILDIKQGDSHKDLLMMLEAVNDETRDINDIVEDYFNRDNLFTFLAMNVILGNDECVDSGYLIYKPVLSSVWFLIPENMSETMAAAGNRDILQARDTGCARFYGNLLFERILSSPEHVEELTDRIYELMKGFEGGTVSGLTDQYIPVLKDYLAVNPDKGIIRNSPQEIIENVDGYLETMWVNVKEFEENMYLPRKVILNEARGTEEGVVLSWSPSAQINDSHMVYELEVAQDPEFAMIIFSEKTEGETQAVLPESALPQGMTHLYYRVKVTDSKGRTTGSRNVYQLKDGSYLYGAASFVGIG